MEPFAPPCTKGETVGVGRADEDPRPSPVSE
jgi:hypothetical protein